jgi:Amt family ammonium transporter
VFRTGVALYATTIVSGATVERLKICSWIVLTLVFLGWVYPLIAHWAYDGWLHKLGYKDYAGAGIVNVVAGSAALITTILLKPRSGRFD